MLNITVLVSFRFTFMFYHGSFHCRDNCFEYSYFFVCFFFHFSIIISVHILHNIVCLCINFFTSWTLYSANESSLPPIHKTQKWKDTIYLHMFFFHQYRWSEYINLNISLSLFLSFFLPLFLSLAFCHSFYLFTFFFFYLEYIFDHFVSFVHSTNPVRELNYCFFLLLFFLWVDDLQVSVCVCVCIHWNIKLVVIVGIQTEYSKVFCSESLKMWPFYSNSCELLDFLSGTILWGPSAKKRERRKKHTYFRWITFRIGNRE